MTATATATTRPGVASSRDRARARRWPFVVAAFAFVTSFAATGAPVTMYATYVSDGIVTEAGLALAAASYFVATAGALLCAGRLSDFLGRRPVALASAMLALAGLTLMAVVDSEATLVTARVLQGLGIGLGTGALGALVMDLSPRRWPWLAPGLVATASMIGISCGALISGFALDVLPVPRITAYAIPAGAVVLCAIGLAAMPETRARARGARRSLRPSLHAPRGLRLVVAATGAAFFGTWVVGGFFQAFGSVVTEHALGASSGVVKALVFAASLVLAPVGAALGARLAPWSAHRIGLALFVLAVCGLGAAFHAGGLVPFVLAALAIGLTQGIATSGAMRALTIRTAPEHRGALTSTTYFISYSGPAVASLLAASVAGSWSVAALSTGYLVLSATVVALAIGLSIPAARASTSLVSTPQEETA